MHLATNFKSTEATGHSLKELQCREVSTKHQAGLGHAFLTSAQHGNIKEPLFFLSQTSVYFAFNDVIKKRAENLIFKICPREEA